MKIILITDLENSSYRVEVNLGINDQQSKFRHCTSRGVHACNWKSGDREMSGKFSCEMCVSWARASN